MFGFLHFMKNTHYFIKNTQLLSWQTISLQPFLTLFTMHRALTSEVDNLVLEFRKSPLSQEGCIY